MTRIDFYVLQANAASQYLNFVCRLTEKAWRQGHQVFILCDDRPAAAEIDDKLWTYRDISFLPHALIDQDVAAPVKIGFDDSVPPMTDVLINLANNVPVFFSRFERVIETTGIDDQQRSVARERYRFYQERGYALDTHNV